LSRGPEAASGFEIVDGEWCSGRYLEIVPGQRVVFTWGWDSGAIPVPPGSSTVEVDLEPHPDGTLVRLVHRDLAPEVRPLHADGWSRFLPRLAEVVAGGGPAPSPRSWAAASRATPAASTASPTPSWPSWSTVRSSETCAPSGASSRTAPNPQSARAEAGPGAGNGAGHRAAAENQVAVVQHPRLPGGNGVNRRIQFQPDPHSPVLRGCVAR
jgi:hypothetical protein